MNFICLIKWILIIILILLLCQIFMRLMGGDRARILGGFLKTGGYEDAEEQTERIYNTLLEYVGEIGTDRHIVDYLSALHDFESIEMRIRTKENQYIKYKQLYEIIYQILGKMEIKDKYDFIYKNGISYKWFLPDKLRAELMRPKNFRKLFDRYAIKSNLEDFMKNRILVGDKMDMLVTSLEPLSRKYIKIKRGDVKKLLDAKSPDIKRDMLEPDTLGFAAILHEIATNVAESTKPDKTVEEKLNEINLIRMRLRDPDAVRRFIARIKPEIKSVEELEDKVIYAIKTPIYRDILLDERERAKARLRAQMDAELREREHKRQISELEREKRRLEEREHREIMKRYAHQPPPRTPPQAHQKKPAPLPFIQEIPPFKRKIKSI